jgi:hypothetical protein
MDNLVKIILFVIMITFIACIILAVIGLFINLL